MRSLCLLLILVRAVVLARADSPGRKWTTIERIQPEHLTRVHEARLRFAAERKPVPEVGVYTDYKAVIHIHAEDSAHTGGTRAGVLEAAKKTGVRVVMFTDHRGPKPETWRGLRDGVLFLAGSEETGLLRFPLFTPDGQSPTNDLRFLCHVEERYDASLDGYAGMEIYNRHTDTKDEAEFEDYFKGLAANQEKWNALVAAFHEFPDEFFAAGADYWPKIFAKWDHELETRPVTGIAANDAHENQVYGGTKFDPYEVSFRNVSTHILARELTDAEIRKSLVAGHAYVAHDWLCPADGFTFVAVNNLGVFTMGDSVPMAGNTRLNVHAPVRARFKLISKGKVLQEETGARVTFNVHEAGAYRVEAWLDLDEEERPWIYSNPIYLRVPSVSDIHLPSSEISSNVMVHRDIQYTTGKSDDENKHQLDVYAPSATKQAPILFFIHGGAWRSGDRSLYSAFGAEFAREGILVVIPSYRLAPRNPHPAQIEDIAAAFAWTAQHAAEFGGDTNRIFVSGHSAGGHLAALLTLDGRYLNKHGLSAKNIRGTLPLSSVFDVVNEGKESKVFGNDPEIQKEASPIRHVSSNVPPFLIAYCEWDYFPLAAQAKRFHAELQREGARTELVFEPHENHISEVLAFLSSDDPVRTAMLRFMRSRDGAIPADNGN